MELEFNGMTPADFIDTARRAIAACEGKTMTEQAALLAGDGLLGICAPEGAGGLGMPLAFAVPVAQAGGGSLLAFPLIEMLVIARCLSAAHEGVAAAASGAKIVTVAWQGAANLAASGSGFVVSGTVGRAPFAESADVIVARVLDGRGVIIDRRNAGVSVGQTQTIDVIHPEFRVSLDGVAVAAGDILTADEMAELDRSACILRAAAIIGSADFCLATAQEHATTRKQFGKPLIANQAIRHHLARHKLALESARVVLGQAVSANGSPFSARAAFQAAVTGGILVSEGAIQIHGGMGFTWEVPLHFHLRHVRALEAQGDQAGNLDRLAEDYIAGFEPKSDAA
ncbi:MAG TPA: acyl-CoA dehydrogenase family protein [Rhizobiaceae bacterium]|nr:acyl-CoA dehydrogenase family protein [Rhizobiaceae bacterium]